MIKINPAFYKKDIVRRINDLSVGLDFPLSNMSREQIFGIFQAYREIVYDLGNEVPDEIQPLPAAQLSTGEIDHAEKTFKVMKANLIIIRTALESKENGNEAPATVVKAAAVADMADELLGSPAGDDKDALGEDDPTPNPDAQVTPLGSLGPPPSFRTTPVPLEKGEAQSAQGGQGPHVVVPVEKGGVRIVRRGGVRTVHIPQLGTRPAGSPPWSALQGSIPTPPSPPPTDGGATDAVNPNPDDKGVLMTEPVQEGGSPPPNNVSKTKSTRGCSWFVIIIAFICAITIAILVFWKMPAMPPWFTTTSSPPAAVTEIGNGNLDCTNATPFERDLDRDGMIRAVLVPVNGGASAVIVEGWGKVDTLCQKEDGTAVTTEDFANLRREFGVVYEVAGSPEGLRQTPPLPVITDGGSQMMICVPGTGKVEDCFVK